MWSWLNAGQARPRGDAHGCRRRFAPRKSETGLEEQHTDGRKECKMRGGIIVSALMAKPSPQCSH